MLHELDGKESTQIIGGKRIKKAISLEGYVDFSILNKFCRDTAKIYDHELYGDVEKVRKLRNKIHLKNLSEIDRIFSKKDVDKIAEIANKVLDIVEKKQK